MGACVCVCVHVCVRVRVRATEDAGLDSWGRAAGKPCGLGAPFPPPSRHNAHRRVPLCLTCVFVLCV